MDIEGLLKADSADELREIKIWLFRENMRLENERREFEQQKDKFLRERVKLRDELDTLNRRTVQERKRLKEENLFFDKKMAILQDGFRQLEEDRKRFEQEKKAFLSMQQEREADRIGDDELAALLFRSARNPLALRKRYRDLIRIFHPDNLFGDEELALSINREFLVLKEQGSERA